MILSPDNDSQGLRHMLAIAASLAGVARSIRWLDPAGWGDGDDLADALAPGGSATALHGMATNGPRLPLDSVVREEMSARIVEVPTTLTDSDDADRTDRIGPRPGSVPSVPPLDPEWPDIEPLLVDRPLPPFPLHALPLWMAAMVEAVSANTETDPCMAAVTALGLASVPLSNRFVVETRAWSERGINLFVVSLAESGELKSAVFTLLDEPLRSHERDTLLDEAPSRRDREHARKETEASLAVARDQLKKAMKADLSARMASGKGPEADGEPSDQADGAEETVTAARAQLRSVQAELDADEEDQPAPYALLADDSTQEALQRQMAQQDGRVGIVSAESELFLMAAGRYSEKAPSLQVYLAGFSGDPLRAERITREAPPVPHPGLAIVITTQPVVFEEARRNHHLQRRGLLARFVYAVPASRAGTRHLADRPPVPEAVAREYGDALARLSRLGDAHRSAAPVRLRLVGEAGRILERWHDEWLEPRRDRAHGDLGATESMAAWAGRLHGLVARIAGILHVAHHLDEASALTIEPDTMTAAIAIGEWAVEHAYGAFGIERLDTVGHDAHRVRRWYRSRSEPSAQFTVRDACRGLRGLEADRVRAALRRLEDHGYLRIDRTKAGSSGGRPSDVVTINPADRAD